MLDQNRKGTAKGKMDDEMEENPQGDNDMTSKEKTRIK